MGKEYGKYGGISGHHKNSGFDGKIIESHI
jgi:hypothetical protein